MPQYLVAIHHPDSYNPSLEGEERVRDKQPVAWGRKGVVACRASVEARVFRNANRIETPPQEHREFK
jgi:hypothetical protein